MKRMMQSAGTFSTQSMIRSAVRRTLAVVAGVALTTGAFAQELKVGLSVSLSGPNSSLGVPYAKGMEAAIAYHPEINGRKVKLIVLDDGSDPTTASTINWVG